MISGTNAAMESFGTTRTGRTARRNYHTRDDARTDVFDYIERFYNQHVTHSTLQMVSLVQFEQTSMGLTQVEARGIWRVV